MNVRVAIPPWGQVVEVDDWQVHDPKFCMNEDACAIHNPSHHMGDWPIVIRLDYGWPLVERTCPHGVGHPDPDSIAWFEGHTGDKFEDGHGCDGCCHKGE